LEAEPLARSTGIRASSRPKASRPAPARLRAARCALRGASAC